MTHALKPHLVALSADSGACSPAELSSAEGRQIRVLNGPMRDATFDPNVHLTLGRGSDCDLQILHDGVSRHHACITTDDLGRHMLVDLESTNGTFVNAKPVERLALEIGTVFEIMRYRFVYEEDVKLAPVDFDPAAPREAGAPISRTTIEYKAFAAEQSVQPPTHATKTPDPAQNTDSQRDTLYDGDIIGDIAEYRSLRTRILRGVPLSVSQEAVFHQLEGRMRPSGRAATAAGSTNCGSLWIKARRAGARPGFRY